MRIAKLRRILATLRHLITRRGVLLAKMKVCQVEVVLVPQPGLHMLLLAELMVIYERRGRLIYLSIIAKYNVILEVCVNILQWLNVP